MSKKAKTLGEYKENLGEKLKGLPGSENLKKEYKGKLFREIVTDPEYKTLKAEYLNEKRSESAKEKIFQEAFTHAKKVNSSLTEEDFRTVLLGKPEKKESKEKMNTPQLESENHKIDQGKSKKEKLTEGWKEEERPAYINGSETKIKVLKKELAPGAFVWEYQDDGKMPKHMVGEQLFNWKAVLNLGLEDRLPTWQNMVAMRGETKEEKQTFLKNNFQKDGKNLFPGYWNPYYKKFYDIGEGTDCWLTDGNIVELNEDDMDHYNDNHEFGFSLRLLKN